MIRSIPLLLMVCTAACSGLGYPCANEEPRCDPGQTCVKEDFLGQTREICKKTEAKDLGAKCTVSEECKGFQTRTAVCADMHRSCPSANDPQCDLRCRPVCAGHGDCGPSQICWPGEGDIPGVCQEGECGETHQDCPTGLRCFWVKSGDTGGFCYAPCDILRQTDCNQSPPPGDAHCCAPQETCVHFAANVGAAACLPAGSATRGQACDTEEENGLPSCVEGTFCSDLLNCTPGAASCTGICYQYCRRLGAGGPVCDNSAACSTFPNGETVEWGYCGQ